MAKKKGDEEMLTAGQSDDPPTMDTPPASGTIDEQINSVGADAPAVTPPAPEPEPPEIGKPTMAPEPSSMISEKEFKVMMRYLAARSMNPAGYEEFLQAFPKLRE